MRESEVAVFGHNAITTIIRLYDIPGIAVGWLSRLRRPWGSTCSGNSAGVRQETVPVGWRASSGKDGARGNCGIRARAAIFTQCAGAVVRQIGNCPPVLSVVAADWAIHQERGILLG